MKRSLWNIIAALCMIAAIGFGVAFMVGGYTPYLVIAVMWVSIGVLNIAVGVLLKRKSEDPKENKQQ
jgi:hypothetical protein